MTTEAFDNGAWKNALELAQWRTPGSTQTARHRGTTQSACSMRTVSPSEFLLVAWANAGRWKRRSGA
jgi:hypothetical protein